MSDKKVVLPDLIPNIGFNLNSQELFANNRGIVIEHWSAIPSPIGLKDRGGYRRSGQIDTFSENGFLYEKTGEFVGTIVGNSRNNGSTDANNIFDQSSARLIMPKFYQGSEEEISLLPGDRLYAKDISLKVDNFQRVQYNPEGEDYLQFPAEKVTILVDANNVRYKQDEDFVISDNGNIKWTNRNPNIDIDTNEGTIYSIRYKYIAYWYVAQLVNEIRVTNDSDASSPQRMPYQAMIQREYVYHNKNNSQEKAGQDSSREIQQPTEGLLPEQYDVKVDINDFE